MNKKTITKFTLSLLFVLTIVFPFFPKDVVAEPCVPNLSSARVTSPVRYGGQAFRDGTTWLIGNQDEAVKGGFVIFDFDCFSDGSGDDFSWMEYYKREGGEVYVGPSDVDTTFTPNLSASAKAGYHGGSKKSTGAPIDARWVYVDSPTLETIPKEVGKGHSGYNNVWLNIGGDSNAEYKYIYVWSDGSPSGDEETGGASDLVAFNFKRPVDLEGWDYLTGRYVEGPINIKSDQDIKLKWKSSGTSSCSASGAWSGAKVTNGLETIGKKIAGTYNFTITCMNVAGDLYPAETVKFVVTTAIPLACSPISQYAVIENNATLTASGGTGTYSWSAVGGTPSSGSGTNFLTKFATVGAKNVVVTSGAKTRTCVVNVVNTLQCSPLMQIVTPGESATLTASGGAGGPYNWTAFEGDPYSGVGSTFITSYDDPGSRIVEVSEVATAQSMGCQVEVPAGDYPLVRVAGWDYFSGAWRTGEISIMPGQSAVIRWFSDNADTCWASSFDPSLAKEGWHEDGFLSGELGFDQLEARKDYEITCSKSGKTRKDKVTINLLDPESPPKIEVSLSANPSIVSIGEDIALSWDSKFATECVASGDWSGVKTLFGSEVRPSIMTNKTYTLECANSIGSAPQRANAEVKVTGKPTLTLIIDGEGSIDHTLGATSLTCEPNCVKQYPQDSDIRLDAIPAFDRTFLYWEGACPDAPASPSCLIDLVRSMTVVAVFSGFDDGDDDDDWDGGVSCPLSGPKYCSACNDGVDNDLDSKTDYPSDSSCRSIEQDSEGTRLDIIEQ